MNDGLELNRHFWLTLGIARVLGISFAAAMLDGYMAKAEFASIIGVCRRCPHGEACLSWLGRHSAGAAAAPDFCGNKGALDALVHIH